MSKGTVPDRMFSSAGDQLASSAFQIWLHCCGKGETFADEVIIP
ncbi:MAG: hypothetical protein RSE98_02215 [Anaerovoracaceae bacterium]